jgi:hypothetical protein
MKLSEQFFLLKDIFDLNKERIEIPGSTTTIFNLDYNSPRGIYDPAEIENKGFPAWEDGAITENLRFKYPVFVPEAGKKYSSVIILLHGLNERFWFKQLAWARYLCESTGKPVLMFPSSFHMNRSLPEWTDKNELMNGVHHRQTMYNDLVDSSIANLVLSQRLTDVPQRFFLSGYQSALDLTAILNDIKAGKHVLFEKSAKVDVFAYSIGVFLAECMMIANPDNLFDDSKFVFFAGGAMFQEMNGVSKYIMDNKAFHRLYNYHLEEMDNEMKENSSMRNVLKDTGMGKAFRSMISYDGLRNFREKTLKKYKSRILSIPLLSDKVIPAAPTVKLLSGLVCKPSNIKMMDFKFPCIHENPFPVNLKEYTSLIDEAFLKVFSLSGSFLR